MSWKVFCVFLTCLLSLLVSPLSTIIIVCRSEVQKWELFAACLEHLGLVMSALQPGMVQAQLGSQAPPPPGLSVMMDLLRESSSPASLMLALSSKDFFIT